MLATSVKPGMILIRTSCYDRSIDVTLHTAPLITLSPVVIGRYLKCGALKGGNPWPGLPLNPFQLLYQADNNMDPSHAVNIMSLFSGKSKLQYQQVQYAH